MAVEYKRFLNRRDSTNNWTNINPVLGPGEIGYDTDEKKFKIGDGTSAWNDLVFYESGSGSAYTPGRGISIASDEISVNARSSQFAFNNGEMYIITTGDGGFVTNAVMTRAINNTLGDILGQLITI